MFANFNTVFKKDDAVVSHVPDVLLEYFNKDVASGFKYVDDGNGGCILIPDNNTMTISELNFVLTDEIKNILGDTPAVDDILKYSYNSQSPLQLNIKDGCLTINGVKIPFEEIHKSPFENTGYIKGSEEFFANPHPFPEPFDLLISNEKYEYPLTIHRVPNKSLNEVKFESSKEMSLAVSYIIDVSKKDSTFSINVNINIQKCTSIKEIVEVIDLYNSFCDGYVKIGNQHVSSPQQSDKKYDAEGQEFWNKVYEIETALEVSFIPPEKGADFQTVSTINGIYQSLIKRLPVRNKENIVSINFDSKSSFEKGIDETIGNPIFLRFTGVYIETIFGVKVEIPSITCIFDAIISRVTEDKDKTILEISDECKSYSSTLLFTSKGELEDYLKTNVDDYFEIFKSASADYVI